jgi:hypothetical protein
MQMTDWAALAQSRSAYLMLLCLVETLSVFERSRLCFFLLDEDSIKALLQLILLI